MNSGGVYRRNVIDRTPLIFPYTHSSALTAPQFVLALLSDLKARRNLLPSRNMIVPVISKIRLLGSGTATATAKFAEPILVSSLGVFPPSMVKLPEYSPDGVFNGAVTSNICAVTDWPTTRKGGVFRKNFVSFGISGAAMFKISEFRKTLVAPGFTIVAEKVTVCPGFA